jgi:hypothetical protein
LGYTTRLLGKGKKRERQEVGGELQEASKASRGRGETREMQEEEALK